MLENIINQFNHNKALDPDIKTGKNLINSIGSAVGDYVRGALFLTAIANLNWSRDYLWYVELDDVPAPFQKGGVIGLPVIDVTFNLGGMTEETFNCGIQELKVPSGRTAGNINLTMYDDEQTTLFTFFERWMNVVYNPHSGVLPVSEAVKNIHIQKLKSTRTPIYRNISRINSNMVGNDSITASSMLVPDTVPGMNFLVYPTNVIQQSMSSSQSDLMKFTVDLRIALQADQDFKSPNKSLVDALGLGKNILERVANYI